MTEPQRPPPTARRVLVVDDDELLRKLLVSGLGAKGYHVVAAASLAEARRAIGGEDFDVVVLDEQLPDGRGHEFCAEIHGESPSTKIVFVTGYPEFEHAVKAIRAGAYDYLVKPFEYAALVLAVERCFGVLELERISRREEACRRRATEVTLVGSSPSFGRVRELVGVAAASDAPVLITGETGTGKTLVAKAIHGSGPRRSGAFVALSCAALPDNLVEAELFGWERGAFTGAVAAHDGAFSLADQGTLFLDEIGDLGLHLQPKLLSALEDREVRRLGGRSAKPVDVRILAATNADVDAMVEAKRFRSDLYYRLAVVHIHVPPLRERAEDIPALARHLLSGICGRREIPAVDDAELDRLASYPWPGNVRELRNVLERSVLLDRGELRPSKLLGGARAPEAMPDQAREGRLLTLDEVEQQQIAEALRRTGGNLAQAARVLGVSLSTLKRRLHASPSLNRST